MSDEPPIRDLFHTKVVAIMLFTSIFLGVAVFIVIKVMGRWRYMPVVAVLVAATGGSNSDLLGELPELVPGVKAG